MVRGCLSRADAERWFLLVAHCVVFAEWKTLN